MRYKLIKGGLLKKNKLPIFVIQKIGSYMSCLADSNNLFYCLMIWMIYLVGCSFFGTCIDNNSAYPNKGVAVL